MNPANPVQDLSRFRMPVDYATRGRFWRLAWWICQETLFRWSPPSLNGFRAALLRAFGAQVGHGVVLMPTSRVHAPWNLEVGDRVWIGDFAVLYTLDRIVIGHDAVVSQQAYLCTGSHDMTRPDFALILAPIRIEAEAWISSGVFIMPGVNVGRGAVAAARSLVTRDIPELAIVMGTPAKVTGRRETRNA